MKTINTYILEKLFISNATMNANDYGHIDALPLGSKKPKKYLKLCQADMVKCLMM